MPPRHLGRNLRQGRHGIVQIHVAAIVRFASICAASSCCGAAVAGLRGVPAHAMAAACHGDARDRGSTVGRIPPRPTSPRRSPTRRQLAKPRYRADFPGFWRMGDPLSDPDLCRIPAFALARTVDHAMLVVHGFDLSRSPGFAPCVTGPMDRANPTNGSRMPIPKPPQALEFLFGRSRPRSNWVILSDDFQRWNARKDRVICPRLRLTRIWPRSSP